MNTNLIGQITETQILLDCLKLGLTVSIPYGNSARYDLIIDYNQQLYRIQIKTSRQANTTKNAFKFNCYSVSNGKRHIYTKKEIDFIATVWQNQSYLIPVEDCTMEKVLWVDEPTQKVCTKAEKYLLKNMFNQQ